MVLVVVVVVVCVCVSPSETSYPANDFVTLDVSEGEARMKHSGASLIRQPGIQRTEPRTYLHGA